MVVARSGGVSPVALAKAPSLRLRIKSALSTHPVLLSVGLVAVPLLVALSAELWFGGSRPLPRGDEAVLELHLRHAVRFEHLLGPYSQYNWYHLGPLYYYVLAPLYFATSDSTRSLYVSAGLINGVAALGMLRVFCTFERAREVRLVFFALAAAAIAGLTLGVPEGALVASPLTEIWNPVVTVLPFGLFLVVAGAVCAGATRWVIALVLLHAFVTQTHVSYLPAATSVLIVSIARCWWSARKASASSSSWLLGGGVVAAIVWAPPLIALLQNQFGSAADFVRFIASDERPRVPLAEALGYGLRQLHAPLLRPLGLSGASATLLALLSTIAQLLGFAAFIGKPRADSRYLPAFMSVLAIVIAISIAQAAGLVSLNENTFYYQTLWYELVGCLAWLGLGIGACRSTRTARLAPALSCALTAFLSFVAVRTVARDFRRSTADAMIRERDPAESLLPSLRVAAFTPSGGGAFALDAGPAGSWSVLASALLQLDKQGLQPSVDRRWRFMFGAGTKYAHRDLPRLEISRAVSHDAPVWHGGGRASLFVPGIERALPAQFLGVRGEGVRGDPAQLLQASGSHEGKAWDAEGAVVLADAAASITFELPRLRVSSFELIADGNDEYLLEASGDGSSFVPAGRVPSVAAWGLRRRAAELEQRGPWRALRIKPGQGDGLFSIAGAELTNAAYACDVIGAQETEGDPGVACDGEAAPEGSAWDAPEALKLLHEGAQLALALPLPQPGRGFVEGVRIEADGNDAYLLEGSLDGNVFYPLDRLSPISKPGLQWRSFYFNDGLNWVALRFSVASGDGAFSIAEIEPIVSRGALLEFGGNVASDMLSDGWSEAEGNGTLRWRWALGLGAGLRVPLEAGLDHDLSLRLRAADIPGERQVLRVELNHHAVGEAPLYTGDLQQLSFRLPGSLVQADNEVRFVFHSARQQPGDPRALAAQFQSALFRPSSL
jgi:hypothetical protein